METQCKTKSILRSKWVRIVVLGLVVLLTVAVVTIIASESNNPDTHQQDENVAHTEKENVVHTEKENVVHIEKESVVHIEIDIDGNVNISPHNLSFDLEANNEGNIQIRFLLAHEMDDVSVSLPDGWSYVILDTIDNEGSPEFYNLQDYYDHLSSYGYGPYAYDDANEYPYEHHNDYEHPYDYENSYEYSYEYDYRYGYEDTYDYGYPYGYNYDYPYGFLEAYDYLDAYDYYSHDNYGYPYSYSDNYHDAYDNNDGYPSLDDDNDSNDYNDDYYDYNEYSGYNNDLQEPANERDGQRYVIIVLMPPEGVCPWSFFGEGAMYIGTAPTYGIVPFNMAGRRVNFNPNGGNAFEGHTYRYTVENGTIGSQANMPYMPWRTGARFLWWSTHPDGRDPAVTNINQTYFGPTTLIPEGGLNLYAIWLFTVSFMGNGMAFPNPNPNNPINPNSYLARDIPEGWNFVEAEAFGLPVTFPWDPRREGFQFWGWYDQRIDTGDITFPPIYPPGVTSVNRYTPILSSMEFFARWRLHTHLVMFDMNHSNAVLAAGTAAQPQRLYRWVLNNRSIADSGLGGNPATGHGGQDGTAVDGAPWIIAGNTGRPEQYYRQNIRRPWEPNVASGPGHVPRWNLDGTANAFFNTPYFPGSGLVRGDGAGNIGNTQGTETEPNAGTAWPRSAPNVYMGNESGTLNAWVPFPGAYGPNNAQTSNTVSRPRYTLEGWWTTPNGWAQNWGAGTMANIVGRRFAPAGNPTLPSTHTQAETASGLTQAPLSFPLGHPFGLARPVVDVTQLPVPPLPATPPPLVPPTGIVTGGEMQDVSGDMTVYAQWVFRVTFNINIPGVATADANNTHGNQNFSLQWNDNFNPGVNNNINFRDIPAHLLPEERTINQSGQRIRGNAGTFTQAPSYGATPVSTTFTWHQPFWAGMPPYSSPRRSAHLFNGWWDRPVRAPNHTHHINCNLCLGDPFAFPAVHYGAVRITGDTQINGNLTAYAHWRFIPTDPVTVRFHLNATPAPSAASESTHGYAYWPTGRPNIAGYDNPHGRFFLNRLATGTTDLGKPPGLTALTEINQPNTIITRYTTGTIQAANVYYGNRYAPFISRTIGYGNAINGSQVTANHRYPRNPRRTGYVFVGWSTNQDLPAFAANGNPTGVAGSARNDNLIWGISTPVNTASAQTPEGGTLDLFAVWAPAIDIIIRGNGHASPTQLQFVRPMPFDPLAGPAGGPGGGFTFNEMNVAARWSSANADGMVWFASQYLHSNMRGSVFTRPGFTPIGPTNAYNTDPLARFDYGSIILATTRFNNDFFSLYPANNLVNNPGGNNYLSIYLQWGTTLTFNSNHNTFDTSLGNTARTVNMPAAQSVNMTFDPALRHSHLPNREDVWPSPWAGTTGLDGTRGGWPRDPRVAGRTSDIDGGDWFALFTQPLVRGWSLIGWHRRASGVCPPTCTFDECWFTPDTIINAPITIFAIWGPYIIFDPGLGGAAVNMDPVRHSNPDAPSDLHWRVNVGQPFPTPHPGDPTWPLEQNFIGWFPQPTPDPTDPLSGAAMLNFNVNVQFARRYYAVWNTMVIFNPTGPAGSTAATGGGMINTIGVAGTPLNRVHFVGRYINIIPSAGEFPTRPGWPDSAFSGNWFAVDASAPNGRRLYHPNDPAGTGSRIVMQGMTVYPEWISTITFRPGHTRGRLNNGTADIVRTVPDGLALNNNIAAQRTPAATSALYPGWPNDPGMNFGGWRRVNAAGQPLNPNGTVWTSGQPIPALLTTDQVNAMVTAGPRYYFEAVWGLRLEFFKVSDMVNPQSPLGFTPLPETRFVLERNVPGSGWVQAYPVPPATYVASDANGRVFISNTYTPLLELPRNENIEFRLIETLAPEGYITPTGHWTVTISHELGVMPAFVATGNNPAFTNITISSGTLAGRRQFVGNIPDGGFEFWKRDHLGNILPDAEFLLLAFNGPGTPNLPNGMVTQAMIGNDANQWSIVGEDKSSLTAPMVFPMRPGRIYQLIETRAPSGFQQTMGQWRITVNAGVSPAPSTLTVTSMGGVHMPGIFPTGVAETYNILNLPELVLPFTGGVGMRTFVISGSGALFMVLCGGVFVFLRRRKRMAAAS